MLLVHEGTLLTLEVSAPVVEQFLIDEYLDEVQIDDKLCWAACISSALVSIKVPTDCELDQRQLARRFICTHMAQYDEEYCNEPLLFEEVVTVWRKVGFHEAEVNSLSGLDYGDLISTEISEGRPVQAYADHVHAVMVYGYLKRSDDEEEVLVMDPQRGVGPRWHTIDSGLEWSALWYALKHYRLDYA